MNLAVFVGLLLAARAATPPDLRPAVEPADFPALYAEHAAAQGRTGAAAEAVCRPFAEGIGLCFTLHDGAVRRYVTRADLAAWGMDLAAVAAVAVAAAAAAIGDARPVAQSIEGVAGTWWLGAEGDGLDAALLLYPDRLAARCGAAPVGASPEAGVLMAWVPGSAELDKVMAVGVRRMHDAADHPVSPRIYRWNGEKWVVWGQAVATDEPARAP